MSCSGFLDAEAARRAMRRMRLRRSLREIVASGTTLLDRIDHVSKVERDSSLALVNRLSVLGQGNTEARVGDQVIKVIAGQDVREQELLQGADLMLQLLNAMNEGVSHGLFSGQSRIEPTAADGAAHRLSQGEK